jgi:hypothetical protein
MLVEVKKWLNAHDFCGESRTIKRLDEAGPLKDDPALFSDERIVNWCEGNDASSALLWITGSKGSGKSILVSAISARLARGRHFDKICAFSFSRRIRDSSVENPKEGLRFLAFDRALQNPLVLERLAQLARSGLTLQGASIVELWNTLFVDEIFQLEPKLFVFINGFERLRGETRDIFLPLLASLPSKRPTIRVIINGNYGSETDNYLRSTSAVKINLDSESDYTQALIRRIIDSQLPPGLNSVEPYFATLQDVSNKSDFRLTHVKILLKAVAIFKPPDVTSAVSKVNEFSKISITELNTRVEERLLSGAGKQTQAAYRLFRKSAALALDRGNVPASIMPFYDLYAKFYSQPTATIIRTATMTRRCTIQWPSLLTNSLVDAKTAHRLFSWLQGFCLRGIVPWDLTADEFRFVRSFFRFTRPLRNGFVLLKRTRYNKLRHWGLFISDLSQEEVETAFQNIKDGLESESRVLGQVHELRRMDGGVNYYEPRDVVYSDLVELKKADGFMLYRGKTIRLDNEISKLGKSAIIPGLLILGHEFIHDHPKYSLWGANCQHFFRALFDDIRIPDKANQIELEGIPA